METKLKSNLLNIYIGTVEEAQKRREHYRRHAAEHGMNSLSLWARQVLDTTTGYKQTEETNGQ